MSTSTRCVCVFFFQILPTLFLCCTCTSPSRPCHAFVASFLPSFLPVSSSFFSVASPFRLSAAGRPAFLLQGNQDYPSDLSRGKTKIPRARSRAIFAEFVGSELVSLLLFLFYLNYSGLLGLFLCYFTSFTGTQVSLVADVFLWLLNCGLCTSMLCGDWGCHNGFFLFWCRSWKCGDFLIGDIRWGLCLLPSDLHAVPAVLPVKILYPPVLGSRN